MSLPKNGLNRRFMLLAPLALAACGFEPAFGTGSTGATLRNRTRVNAPTDQNSYLLTREVEARLGRTDTPLYDLTLDVQTAERVLAINREGDIGRRHLWGLVNYTLRDLKSGQILGSHQLENFVGYSSTGTTVVTLAGERDARERLMRVFADQLVTRLLTLDLKT